MASITQIASKTYGYSPKSDLFVSIGNDVADNGPFKPQLRLGRFGAGKDECSIFAALNTSGMTGSEKVTADGTQVVWEKGNR